MKPTYDLDAAVERALDDGERQTGERQCSDPILLAPIAAILREVYAAQPKKKRKR